MQPCPFRFTLAQFYEMDRLNYFGNRRVELIRGEVLLHHPVSWPHSCGTHLLWDELRRAFEPGHFVCPRAPFPIPAVPDTLAVPDVTATPGSLRDYSDHPTVLALVAEVADQSLSFDLTTKAELYATAGVPEYWVLDVTARELHVFRDPQPLPAALGATAYQLHTTHADTESVSPLGAPHAHIAVGELLP